MDIHALIERAGGVSKLAQRLRVSHSTVCDWKKAGFIPGGRAAQIANEFEIPPGVVLGMVRPSEPREVA